MSTTVLFALAVLAQQDADPKVTYETVAVPLSRALGDLNKSAGTRWKVSPQLQNEIVLVRVTDVPASELKERLARAVLGLWTKLDDGSEVLTIDSVARANATRAKDTARFKQIEEGLKRMRESLVPPKATNSQAEAKQEMDFDGPGSGAGDRLIAHLSTSLRASDVATLKKGDRVVYSTAPTPVQRRLNVPNLAQIVAEFVQAHNRQAASSSLEQADQATLEQIEKAKALLGDFMPENKKIEQPPAKILFVVERGGMFGFMGDMTQLHAIAFDAQGRVLATASDALTGGGLMDPSRGDVATVGSAATGEEGAEETQKTAPESTPQDKALAKPIELSPLSQELKELTSFDGRGKAPRKMSAELRAMLLRPDQHDPLSFESSENILALAKAESNNLVALMSDGRMDFSTISRMGQAATLALVKETLINDVDVKVTYDKGWMSLSPADPEEARTNRVDRKSLAQLLASADQLGIASLDSLASYATVNPPITETPVALSHVMLLAPNAMSMGMSGVQDWPMLRLYGLLTTTERGTLRGGKALPLTSFSPKAQAILSQMLFGAGTKLQIGPDKESALGMFATLGFGRLSLKSFKEEPTEVMPNGLASGGVLKLDLKPGHFVLASTEGMEMFGRMMGAMGPQEYAMLKYFSTEPEMAQMSSMMPKLDKFQVGARETLDFRIVVAADVSQKHTLLDNKIAKGAPLVGPDALPADFLAEVDKQMKLYKEGLSPFMQMGRMIGGEGVPPK